MVVRAMVVRAMVVRAMLVEALLAETNASRIISIKTRVQQKWASLKN
jgi:hypothetical protein